MFLFLSLFYSVNKYLLPNMSGIIKMKELDKMLLPEVTFDFHGQSKNLSDYSSNRICSLLDQILTLRKSPNTT